MKIQWSIVVGWTLLLIFSLACWYGVGALVAKLINGAVYAATH